MDLDEFQNKSVGIVKLINGKYNFSHDADATVLHLLEELGEIARELYNQKSGRDKLNKENLEGEFADVFILLAYLASQFDVNVKKAIENKIEILKKRHKLN